MAPKTIGRFKVGKQLGSGSQGTVYLCADTELQRRVAIKLLNRSLAEETYRAEARAMSQLQHPNIVSIYEAGEQNGTPYMVFEYVEGQLLSDVIREDKLDHAQKIAAFRGLLEGVSQAHRVGIVHRDLKPGNIILNGERIPKIMDFGIARLLSGGKERDQQLIGTPRYLAPEYISKGEVGPQNDVFALGLIMDEVLTGMPVFSGQNKKKVMDNILKITPRPPSQFNEAVDEKLDRFILKALERNPDSRYSDATDMLQAFNAMFQSTVADDVDTDAGHGTVEFLLRRMKRKSDFPVLSQSVRSINAMSQASDKDVNHIAGVIVKDFALTNKILKVVNSAFYGRFSGRIGTVSRAVVVLGIQAIRSLAASLIFFEHIQDKAQAEQLRELVSSAMFSATFANQVAKDMDRKQAEDFFLSAMLRDLGKILVAFYLPEEASEIERMINQESMESLNAQHNVLGVSYEKIGIEIAQQWNFPKSLTQSMRHWKPGETPKSLTDKRRLVAEFSKEAGELMVGKGLENKEAVNNLLKKYQGDLGLDNKKFKQLASNAFDEFHEVAKALSADISQSFVRKLSNGIEQKRGVKPAAVKQEAKPKEDGLTETQILNGEECRDEIDETLEIDRQEPSRDTEAMLMDGLQEVTGLLVGEYSVAEIFNVVLESMYRSMDFRQVVLALLDRKSGQMVGRLGFGEESDSFIKQFKFPIHYSVDVFHGALKNAVDVYISNTADKKMQADIPDWYKKISDAGSFLLFPLVVNQRPVGLIYADHAKSNGLEIDKKKLNLLKMLRNQIVLAVKS
ncbi:MAG: HDOD domain-containing protein [Pseudomonadota bacterium]